MKLCKKTGALFMAAVMCLSTLTGFSSAAAAISNTTPSAIIVDDLSAYSNLSVFVQYADGNTAVKTYETQPALAQGIKTLSADESVVLIQPNFTYMSAALTVNDELSGEQWALANDGSFRMETQGNEHPVYDDPFERPAAPGRWFRPMRSGSTSASAAKSGIDINASEAWDVYDGGERETVIALIDTGVDYTHEDLSDAIWVNTDEIADNGIDDDGNGYIDDVYGWNFYDGNNQIYTDSSDDAHGTHGAGSIAAKANNETGIAGVVSSNTVKIMVLKALGGSDGAGTTDALVKAITYAQANGADIVNLSLGSSSDDRALYKAIAQSDMLFVCAAGNDGKSTDTSASYPASYSLENIISVANLCPDGTLHRSSNYGAHSVDLAAPGTYILSTTPDNTYSYMTGTSMAAPLVSAAAAMVYSYFSDLSLAQVKAFLLSTAQPLSTLEGKTVSGGMLNLGAAMHSDPTSVTDENWTAPIADKGTAPIFSTQIFTAGGRTYLRMTVIDAEDDINTVKYDTGTKTASDFASGGTAVKLYGNSVLFRVSASGTITFYAVDAEGNEAIKTLTVTIQDGYYTFPF